MLRVKLCLLAALAFGMSGLVFQSAAFGEEKKETKKDKDDDVKAATEDKEWSAIEQLRTAYALVAYGKKNESPEALLTAARMFATVGSKEFDKDDKIEATKAEGRDPKAEALKLVDDAESMAPKATKAAIEALAKNTRTFIEKTRGATGYPRTFYGTVSRKDQIDTYYITFKGGAWGKIYAYNYSGKGDIDLYVYNSAGRQVARDYRSAASAEASFWVPKQEQYKARIRFYRGPGRLQYRLTSN